MRRWRLNLFERGICTDVLIACKRLSPNWLERTYSNKCHFLLSKEFHTELKNHSSNWLSDVNNFLNMLTDEGKKNIYENLKRLKTLRKIYWKKKSYLVNFHRCVSTSFSLFFFFFFFFLVFDKVLSFLWYISTKVKKEGKKAEREKEKKKERNIERN